MLQETEEAADGTAIELTNQRQQIERITEEAIEIDTLLTRADRLVKVFSKRMMTDKVRSLVRPVLCGIVKEAFLWRSYNGVLPVFPFVKLLLL